MVKHTITVPEPMSSYITGQIKSGQYGNVSEYFRDLVRRDQERRQMSTAELRSIIDQAESSGFSSRSIDDIWNNKVSALRK